MGTIPASCCSMPFDSVRIMLLTVRITILHIPMERDKTGKDTSQCDLGIKPIYMNSI